MYILDLAAVIRSTVKVPDTFEQLALNLLQAIPAHYRYVYVACDTYRDVSIKSPERKLRGESNKFLIRSGKVKIAPEFQTFLCNEDNKERLFKLIEKMGKWLICHSCLRVHRRYGSILLGHTTSRKSGNMLTSQYRISIPSSITLGCQMVTSIGLIARIQMMLQIFLEKILLRRWLYTYDDLEESDGLGDDSDIEEDD